MRDVTRRQYSIECFYWYQLYTTHLAGPFVELMIDHFTSG